MSETTDKINKLATQHKVIGVKTDCKYFSNVGNLCSRVENGMMRCDEYLECEFKYIDALKEENATLREFLNQYQEEANALKSYETYKVWLNNEYRKENEKLKQYLLNIAMIIEELEQQYDDIKDFTEIKEIKEILREVK